MDVKDRWDGKLLLLSRNQSNAKRDGPAIRFDTLLVDQQDLQKEATPSTVKYIFPFRNDGTATLQIQDVRSSCGCVIAPKSVEPVLPGQKGEIEIGLDLTPVSGTFWYDAVARTNDPRQPVMRLTLAGRTTQHVGFSGKALVMRGNRSSSTAKGYLYLETKAEASFHVASITYEAGGGAIKHRVVSEADFKVLAAKEYGPQAR
ncbi:MAG: DUF1573 domain-containing protein, partial [Phycisphaerales bacterium]|nr:DUF1573 domain-containing protein [Phycisphaerales bacterium]